MEYDGIKWDKISWLFLEFTEMGSPYIDLGHARLRLKTTWYVHTHEVSFVEMWYRNDRTLTFMFFLISSRVIWTSYSAYANCSCPIEASLQRQSLCAENHVRRRELSLEMCLQQTKNEKKHNHGPDCKRHWSQGVPQDNTPKSLRSHQKADGQ